MIAPDIVSGRIFASVSGQISMPDVKPDLSIFWLFSITA